LIGIVLAAHEHLADALCKAATSVLGELERLVAISIDPRDGAPQIQEKFKKAIEQVKMQAGVLILTDMFGGTPANIGLTLHDGKAIELLTGVNLPMVIKAVQLSQTEMPLSEVAQTVKGVGLRSITVASDLLSGKVSEKGALNV
jgi:mannose PTS system EIIA component